MRRIILVVCVCIKFLFEQIVCIMHFHRHPNIGDGRTKKLSSAARNSRETLFEHTTLVREFMYNKLGTKRFSHSLVISIRMNLILFGD